MYLIVLVVFLHSGCTGAKNLAEQDVQQMWQHHIRDGVNSCFSYSPTSNSSCEQESLSDRLFDGLNTSLQGQKGR